MPSSVDELLTDHPTNPSWLLFGHVRPIVEMYIKTGKAISIDEVFQNNSQKRQEQEEALAATISEWIEGGLPHLWAAENMFASFIRRANVREDGKEIDLHQFDVYSTYHKSFVGHADRIKKKSKGIIAPETEALIDKIKAYDPRENKLDLNREVHLAFKHGKLIVSREEHPQVLLQIGRIKEQGRMGKKFSRYLCNAMIEYEELNKALKESENPELRRRIVETLGAMHAYKLQTPFAEQEDLRTRVPNPVEYALMRARVSDVLGTALVVRERKEVYSVLKRLINGRFERNWEYGVLSGKRLQKERGKWEYVDALIIDDHIMRGENVLAAGNNNIYTYVVPKETSGRFNWRVDFGIYGFSDFCMDAVGAPGSHLMYEAKQEKEVEEWKITKPGVYKLYQSMVNAVGAVLERVDIRKYALFKPERKTGIDSKAK